MQTHELEIEEHSHAGMANRYVAAARHLPFAVMRGYNGTSLPEHTDTIKSITCPFTGEQLTAVPALDLDVGIIHAQQADKRATSSSGARSGVQKETVLGAKRSIVTVEEIVDELEPQPNGVVLPRWVVTRVAHVPGGAKPSYAQDYYDRDNAGLQGTGTRSRRTASSSTPGWRRYELRSRRDDERRRRPRAARTSTPASWGSGCRAPAPTSPAAPTHPDLVLVYEAGAIGAKPPRLPL